MVAIGVATGTWVVGENVIAATDRLREKSTGAVDVWLLRVGYRALHNFDAETGEPLVWRGKKIDSGP